MKKLSEWLRSLDAATRIAVIWGVMLLLAVAVYIIVIYADAIVTLIAAFLIGLWFISEDRKVKQNRLNAMVVAGEQNRRLHLIRFWDWFACLPDSDLPFKKFSSADMLNASIHRGLSDGRMQVYHLVLVKNRAAALDAKSLLLLKEHILICLHEFAYQNMLPDLLTLHSISQTEKTATATFIIFDSVETYKKYSNWRDKQSIEPPPEDCYNAADEDF